MSHVQDWTEENVLVHLVFTAKPRHLKNKTRRNLQLHVKEISAFNVTALRLPTFHGHIYGADNPK